MAEDPRGVWRISLFGALRVRSPDGSEFPIGSRKAAELLAYLAVRNNPIVERDAAANDLWPDGEVETGRNRLKQTLAVLRREAPGLPVRALGKSALELARDQVEIDLEVLDRRMRWFSEVSGPARAQAADLMARKLRGGLLPGFSAPWLEPERARCERYSRLLAPEAAQIQPPSSVPFTLGHNLDAYQLSIIDREELLGTIRTWLRTGASRRLCLVGAPGVGKTRILSEILRESRYLVEAAVWISPDPASAAGWLQGDGDGGLSPDLVRLMREFTKSLLVVDDADRLSNESRRGIDLALRAVPSLRILASSTRLPTGADEEVLRVGPLHVSDKAGQPAAALLARYAEVDAGDAAIRGISEQLDGLPAALEAAGAFIKIMGVYAFADEIDRRMVEIVRLGPPDRPSLLDRIDESARGISAVAWDGLVRLAVCADGCGGRLAGALLGEDWPAILQTLWNHSLVERGNDLAAPRYRCLAPISCAIRALAGRDAEGEARARLLHAVSDTLRWARQQFESGKIATCIHWLRAERLNIYSLATRGGTDSAFAEALAPMALAYAGIGREREFQEMVATVNPGHPLEDPPPAVQELSDARNLLLRQSWFDAGILAEQAAERFRSSGETGLLFEALLVGSIAAWGQGDPGEGTRLLNDARGLDLELAGRRFRRLMTLESALGQRRLSIPDESIIRLGG